MCHIFLECIKQKKNNFNVKFECVLCPGRRGKTVNATEKMRGGMANLGGVVAVVGWRIDDDGYGVIVGVFDVARRCLDFWCQVCKECSVGTVVAVEVKVSFFVLEGMENELYLFSLHAGIFSISPLPST